MNNKGIILTCIGFIVCLILSAIILIIYQNDKSFKKYYNQISALNIEINSFNEAIVINLQNIAENNDLNKKVLLVENMRKYEYMKNLNEENIRWIKMLYNESWIVSIMPVSKKL